MCRNSFGGIIIPYVMKWDCNSVVVTAMGLYSINIIYKTVFWGKGFT